MIFNLNKLVNGKITEIEYSPDFSDSSKFKKHFPLIDIKSISAKVALLEVDDLLTVSVKGNAKVELVCSISLEHFVTNQRFEENYEFTFDENNDEFDHLDNEVEIDLDTYVFASLSVSIPMVPVKPGAKMQNSGKSFRVISESELNKEKEEKLDPRFSALDDIEL